MKKRVLSLVLALAMVVSLVTPALAADTPAFPDTDGHWAQSSIERWSSAGVLNGKGDGFDPDAGMTRAEFAQMLVNLLGYTEKAQNTFKDVPNDAWFADAVLKLAAAGVMQGDGVNANPNAEISRAEMAVLLCRALNIQPKADDRLSFADAASVPSWAEDAMAALAERGMLNGVGGNQVAPTLSVNRASVAKLLDNAVGVYANQPNQVISGEVKGLVIVVADGVTLKDATVAENLVVAPKAGGAAVTVTGKSTVGDVYVSADGATLTVDKDAAVKSLELRASDAALNVSGSVGTVVIAESASGAAVNVAKGGSIDTVKTSADDVKIAGEGTVKSVEILAGDKVAVDTKGTEVTVADGVTNATQNGEALTPGGTTGGGASGGGGGGGGGGDTPKAEYQIMFDANGGTFGRDEADKDITVKTVYTVNQTVSAAPAPSREGYSLSGWNTKADGSGDTADLSKPFSAAATLYAQWTREFYITFDANGGSFGKDGEDKDITAKSVYTVGGTVASAPAPGRGQRYTLDGWNTKADGSGDKVDLTKPFAADATVYAVWLEEYLVTFDPNGGKIGGKAEGKEIYTVRGTIAADRVPEAVYAALTFDGWNTKDDGSGDKVDFTKPFTADATVYAKWMCTVTFDGLDNNAPQTVTVARNATVSASDVTEPVRDSSGRPFEYGKFAFRGWYTDDTYATAVDFSAGVTQNVTYYAKWETTDTKRELVYTLHPTSDAQRLSNAVYMLTADTTNEHGFYIGHNTSAVYAGANSVTYCIYLRHAENEMDKEAMLDTLTSAIEAFITDWNAVPGSSEITRIRIATINILDENAQVNRDALRSVFDKKLFASAISISTAESDEKGAPYALNKYLTLYFFE